MANSGYNAYMRSPQWRRRRARAIKRAGTRCEYVDKTGKRCWVQSWLQVHHKSYDRFAREKAVDLEVLCGDHHAVRELTKLYCHKCNKPMFASDAKAMSFWKEFKRKYPKDWKDAIIAAKAAATLCEKCKDDKGGAALGPVQDPK